MPGRRNYENAVRRACRDVEAVTGENPLQYIIRPGGSEAPRYVFTLRTCLGGREALDYAQGLADAATILVAAGLDARESNRA